MAEAPGKNARVTLSRQVNVVLSCSRNYNCMPLSRLHTLALAVCIGGLYLVWGVMFSIQPPFYPKEAEAKGATPSQVTMEIFLHDTTMLQKLSSINSMVLCLA